MPKIKLNSKELEKAKDGRYESREKFTKKGKSNPS